MGFTKLVTDNENRQAKNIKNKKTGAFICVVRVRVC